MVHYGMGERRTRQQEASLLSNLPPTPPQQPRFLDRFRTALPIRGRPPEVVEAFARWVRDFILFHSLRYPETMGEAEIGAFLTHLAPLARDGVVRLCFKPPQT